VLGLVLAHVLVLVLVLAILFKTSDAGGTVIDLDSLGFGDESVGIQSVEDMIGGITGGVVGKHMIFSFLGDQIPPDCEVTCMGLKPELT